MKNLDDQTAEIFLENSVKERFGASNTVPKNDEWLSKAWNYITSRLELCHIKHVPLIPLETESGLKLHKLTDARIMKQLFGSSLPDGVCRALEAMSITVVHTLPAWMRYDQIQTYIYSPSIGNVLELLERVSTNDVMRLNTVCREEDRKTLLSYIGECESLSCLNPHKIKTLQKMKLFTKTVTSWCTTTLVAAEEISEMIEKEDLPVRYPRPFLVGTHLSERNLAAALGVKIVQRSFLIVETLKAMQQTGQQDFGTSKYLYSMKEKTDFIKYLLRFYSETENNFDITNEMKSVAFIECFGNVKVVSDVFDSTEKMASEFFFGKSVFPDDTDFHREPYLSGLLKLGMRTLETLRLMCGHFEFFFLAWSGKYLTRPKVFIHNILVISSLKY